MIVDELKIETEVYSETVDLVFSNKISNEVFHTVVLNLSQLEEFQGRLAIAAVKLRGKLAKEATSQ